MDMYMYTHAQTRRAMGVVTPVRQQPEQYFLACDHEHIHTHHGMHGEFLRLLFLQAHRESDARDSAQTLDEPI